MEGFLSAPQLSLTLFITVTMSQVTFLSTIAGNDNVLFHLS